mmetsp:Transcript_13689/g.22817  ORF Transcript_13689/g.22817 Transcript_13689/m.22817 type:complete len:283 (-) Transcript_13689:155-1003(-)
MDGWSTLCLLDLGIPDTLDQDLLRGFATHIGIRGLVGHKHTADLPLLRVDLAHGELDVSVEHVELLVVFVEQRVATVHAVLQTGKSAREVISSGGTTAFGVQEQTRSVGRNSERAAEVGSRLDSTGGGGLGDEILHREKERNTSTSWNLHSGSSIVDTVFLGEGNFTVLHFKVTRHPVERVCLTSHELGVYKFFHRNALGNTDLFLNLPGGRFNAKISKLHLLVNIDGTFAGDFRASVGKTTTLHLHVTEGKSIGLGQSMGRHGTNAGCSEKTCHSSRNCLV